MDALSNFLAGVANTINGFDAVTLIAAMGILTSASHYLLRNWKPFTKVRNIVVSFVLPVGSAVLTALVTNQDFVSTYPQIYVATQAVYRVVEAIKEAGRKAVTAVEAPQV